jgi:hypothetical protein
VTFGTGICYDIRVIECLDARLVGESFLKGKKRDFGRGETVELYSFEFKLKIDVPDYRSDLREEFSRLEPDISSAGSARKKNPASLTRYGASKGKILAQRASTCSLSKDFHPESEVVGSHVPLVKWEGSEKSSRRSQEL